MAVQLAVTFLSQKNPTLDLRYRTIPEEAMRMLENMVKGFDPLSTNKPPPHPGLFLLLIPNLPEACEVRELIAVLCRLVKLQPTDGPILATAPIPNECLCCGHCRALAANVTGLGPAWFLDILCPAMDESGALYPKWRGTLYDTLLLYMASAMRKDLINRLMEHLGMDPLTLANMVPDHYLVPQPQPPGKIDGVSTFYGVTMPVAPGHPFGNKTAKLNKSHTSKRCPKPLAQLGEQPFTPQPVTPTSGFGSPDSQQAYHLQQTMHSQPHQQQQHQYHQQQQQQQQQQHQYHQSHSHQSNQHQQRQPNNGVHDRTQSKGVYM